MIGSDMRDPGRPPDPSDSEHSSTKPDGSERPPSRTRKSRRSQRHSRYPGDHDSGPSSSSDSSDSESSDFSSDFLAIEPESDHDSDSVATKRTKRAARRKYRAKMAKLKYQQGFLKHEPPFTYQGEPNATTFKKWIREVHEWKSRAQLSTRQSIRMLGKYLGGQAYKFFERDVLDLRKNYSLTEFFEHLFDYIFPPDFQMLQRLKFSECHQDSKQSVRDYLRQLRDLADTAGDVEERELVRQFWMNCLPYIKASLVDKGYKPNTVSLETLKQKSLRTERAFQENSHDPNILLALNPTLVSGYAHHSLHRRTTNRPNITRRDNTTPRTQSLQANSIAGPSSSPRNPRPSFGRPTGDRKPNGRWGGKPDSTTKNTEHLKKLRELNKWSYGQGLSSTSLPAPPPWVQGYQSSIQCY
jgi:hypothetical protein